jgi:hypothetical protein
VSAFVQPSRGIASGSFQFSFTDLTLKTGKKTISRRLLVFAFLAEFFFGEGTFLRRKSARRKINRLTSSMFNDINEEKLFNEGFLRRIALRRARRFPEFYRKRRFTQFSARRCFVSVVAVECEGSGS